MHTCLPYNKICFRREETNNWSLLGEGVPGVLFEVQHCVVKLYFF